MTAALRTLFPVLALVTLPAIAACSSPTSAAKAPSEHFDPLAGDYPQVMWMCNVYEVPAQVEVRTDGTVALTSNPKARGCATVERSQLEEVFASLQALPGARRISEPALLSKMDVESTVKQGDQDKAGNELTSRSITLLAGSTKRGLDVSVEVTHVDGSFSTSGRVSKNYVGEGGALILATPGARADGPWTVVVVRPSVIRSVDDYPFQTAS
jgi:hypothetical protein